MMLPLIFIIMTFGVERLCHYRLVFLALEFVQWSRLQREELESLFKCGNVLYGAMFDKETLKTHDLFMKPSLKDSSHAPPPNKDHDEHGDRGGVTEMLDEQEQKEEKLAGKKLKHKPAKFVNKPEVDEDYVPEEEQKALNKTSPSLM